MMQFMRLRHPEKVRKVVLALKYDSLFGHRRRYDVIVKWDKLVRRIRDERDRYISQAKAAYEVKADLKLHLEPD